MIFVHSHFLVAVLEIFKKGNKKAMLSYLQWTSRVTVSKSGISVAAFDASHL
jgi:hypothetical protein